MGMPLVDGVAFLSQVEPGALFVMFWHTILLEMPRYVISGAVVAVAAVVAPASGGPPPRLSVSVLLPGHNEAHNLRRSVLSIREQTIDRCQIVIVDAGSSAGMAAVAERLKSEDLVDVVVATQIRGGKSAAANLGFRYCTGDIIIIADADTTYDRDAFAELLRPFADPAVGAVSGNLGARNTTASLLTRWQAVQYLVSISLGRRVSDMFGILFIVSGAFGAFRRTAIQTVGGWDVGPGEDADLTIKMRRAGWRVRFAPDAWSLTDVPETLRVLVNQQMRWNRSLVRVRMRKFGGLFDPTQASFTLRDAIGTADIIFFQAVLAVSFVGYLFWLFVTYGSFAWVLIGAVSVVYIVMGAVSFLAAAAISGWHGKMSLLPYALTYGLFNAYFMRFVRLAAYIDELVWRKSYQDDYVPRRVRERTERF